MNEFSNFGLFSPGMPWNMGCGCQGPRAKPLLEFASFKPLFAVGQKSRGGGLGGLRSRSLGDIEDSPLFSVSLLCLCPFLSFSFSLWVSVSPEPDEPLVVGMVFQRPCGFPPALPVAALNSRLCLSLVMCLVLFLPLRICFFLPPPGPFPFPPQLAGERPTDKTDTEKSSDFKIRATWGPLAKGDAV